MRLRVGAIFIFYILFLSACGGSDNGLLPTASEGPPPGLDDDPGTNPITDPIIDPAEDDDPIDVPIANAAPIARDDSINIQEDAPLGGFDVLANDSDPDGDTLEVVSASVSPEFGQTRVLDSNRIRFDPAANLNGVVIVDVVISDGTNEASSSLEIIIAPVDDRIIVRDDYFTIAEASAPVNMAVLENDEDISGGGIRLEGASASVGEVVVDGDQLIYTPPQDFTGTVMMTYEAQDVDLDIEEGMVTIEIYPTEGERFRFEWQDPSERRDGVAFSDAEIDSYLITTKNLVTEEVNRFSVAFDNVERVNTNGDEVNAVYELSGLRPGFFELSVQVTDSNGTLGEIFTSSVVRVGG